nr:Integrase, catalytic core [Ipomoea batatas]
MLMEHQKVKTNTFNQDKLNDETSLETDIVLPSGGILYSDNEEQVQDTTISPEIHQQHQEDIDTQSQSVPSVQEGDTNAESAVEPQLRRSTRIRTIPPYLNDYACQNTTVKRTSPHIISNVLSYSSLSQKYRAFAVNALVHSLEPQSYSTTCGVSPTIKASCYNFQYFSSRSGSVTHRSSSLYSM